MKNYLVSQNMSFLVGHVEISLEFNGAEQSINHHLA